MPWPKDPIKYEEMKLKQSNRMKEKFKDKTKHPMYGKKQPSSFYEKIIKNQSKKRQKRLLGRDEFGRFLKGENHPMKTPELKKKSSISHKESPSSRKGLPSPMKGKKHSLKTRKLMSLSAIGKNTWSKGRPSPLKGIPLKPDHIAKLKEKRRHRVFPKKDSKPERMMQIALALNGIKFEKHKPIIGQPDIFIEPNICIFVDGDYPHANPKKYKPDDMIWSKKASEKWAYDIQINNELSKLGYFIIRLWDSDIYKNIQGCAENVIQSIEQYKGMIFE